MRTGQSTSYIRARHGQNLYELNVPSTFLKDIRINVVFVRGYSLHIIPIDVVTVVEFLSVAVKS